MSILDIDFTEKVDEKTKYIAAELNKIHDIASVIHKWMTAMTLIAFDPDGAAKCNFRSCKGIEIIMSIKNSESTLINLHENIFIDMNMSANDIEKLLIFRYINLNQCYNQVCVITAFNNNDFHLPRFNIEF